MGEGGKGKPKTNKQELILRANIKRKPANELHVNNFYF